jgi:hypothetical protein
VDAVRAVASDRGISSSDMDDVALVRKWERYSEMAAANWLIPNEDDIARLVDQNLATFRR